MVCNKNQGDSGEIIKQIPEGSKLAQTLLYIEIYTTISHQGKAIWLILDSRVILYLRRCLMQTCIVLDMFNVSRIVDNLFMVQKKESRYFSRTN